MGSEGFAGSAKAWLDALPDELRRAQGACMYELGDSIVYPQLADPPAEDRLRQTAEFVSDQAESYIDGDPSPLAAMLLEEQRLPELGLLLFAAFLSNRRIPRHQGFYPAILLDREVLSVVKETGKRENPGITLLWAIFCAREPNLARRIHEAAAPFERGFGARIRWPDGLEATRLRAAITAARVPWESLGGRLLFAARDAGGKLPFEAVEAALPSNPRGETEIKWLVHAINRERQKITPEDILRCAMTWPLRASRVLGNLEGELGWLRLYVAYLEALLSGLYRTAQSSEKIAHALLDTSAEAIERDIAFPLASGVGPIEDATGLFEDLSYDQTRKKRLSRQRERCLRGVPEIAPADWIDLLRDIAAGSSDEA